MPGSSLGPSELDFEGDDYRIAFTADGDFKVEHKPSGRSWVFHSDGTVRAPAVQPAVLATEAEPVVNVDAFGAEGDGTTDDAAAIQAAVDSIPADQKGAITFSAGKKYRIGSTISIDVDNVRAIYGNNAYLLLDADIVGLAISGSFTNTTGPESGDNQTLAREEFMPIIQNLQIGADQGDYWGTGLRLTDIFGTKLHDIHVFGVGRGIEFTGRHRNVAIEACNVWDIAGRGIYLNSANVHQINVYGNHVSFTATCFEATGDELANLHLVGNDFEEGIDGGGGAAPHIIRISTVSWLGELVITGNTFQDHETVTTSLVELDNAGARNTIANNYIGNAVVPGLRIIDPQQVSVKGNRFDRIGDDTIVVRASGETDSLTITENDFVNGDGWATTIDGGDWNGLRWADNHLDEMADGLYASLDSLLAFSCSNNTARHHFGTFLDVETTGSFLIDGAVTGNAVHTDPNAVAPHLVRLAKVATSGKLFNLVYEGNTLRGRSDITDGVVIDGNGDEQGCLVKNNFVRHLGSGSAFILPDSSPSDIVTAHNIDSSR